MISMLMRYVFVIIGLMIVWRSLRWMQRDARAYRKELRALPDAGLVGEMVNLATGEAQPLPREGTIGSSRECDIRVKGGKALRTHARFEFVDGKGLKIIPVRRSSMLLGGSALRGPGYALHGTQLDVGGIPLRVRLFAGLNVPHPAAFPEPDAVLDADEAPPMWEQPAEAESNEAYPLYDSLSMLPERQHYDGNFTQDGQMTWQYAYSTEDLRAAMDRDQWRQMQPTGQVPDEAESEPYQRPVIRRRRRDRHA